MVPIWCLDRTSPTADRFRYPDPLDEEERARRDRFHREEDRDRFTLGRGLVRSALAAMLGPEPRLDFALEEFGRPFLARHPAGPWFSIAHSGNLVVAAVSAATPRLGVDVEADDGRVDIDDLARTVCAEEERAWLERLDPQSRRFGFFGLWTLKEAYLKATGLGLQREPDRQIFSLEGGPRALSLELAPGESLGDWRFHLWRLPGGYQLAFAAPTRAGLGCIMPAEDIGSPSSDLAPD